MQLRERNLNDYFLLRFTIDGVKMTNGLNELGGEYYYAQANGVLAVNSTIWVSQKNDLIPEEGDWHSFDAEGKLVKTGFVTGGGATYYYDNNVLALGFTKIGEDYYFFNAGSGKMYMDTTLWVGSNDYGVKSGIDIVLLTLMADVRLVAVYSVYNMVISSIRSITEAFSGGMEAVFGEWIAKGDIPALQLSYRKYKTLISAASLVLFSCAGILIVPFIMLYTKEITDADYIQPAFALVFLVAEAVNCLVLPCSSLPVAANHLKQTRWGAYGEAMINIFLSCILIKWNPLLGVALGTLVATMFRAVYYMIYSAKNFLHLPVYRILLPCCGTIFLLCAIALCGAFLIQTVKIRNYFSWMLWGLLCLLIIALPVAAAVRNYIKRIQCRRQI